MYVQRVSVTKCTASHDELMDDSHYKDSHVPVQSRYYILNPLNAELNPICYLLILLGDLTLMRPCIVSISNKMQHYTVYLYLETALHVSGGTSTHHQEHIQLSTASGICHTITAICRYRGRVGTGLSVLWVAYATHSTLKPVL
jgi:hypothetical protein